MKKVIVFIVLIIPGVVYGAAINLENACPGSFINRPDVAEVYDSPSCPDGMVQVGNNSLYGNAVVSCLQATSAPVYCFLFAESDVSYVDDTGYVSFSNICMVDD